MAGKKAMPPAMPGMMPPMAPGKGTPMAKPAKKAAPMKKKGK